MSANMTSSTTALTSLRTTLWDYLRVLIKRGSDVAVTQVGLHVLWISEASEPLLWAAPVFPVLPFTG